MLPPSPPSLPLLPAAVVADVDTEAEQARAQAYAAASRAANTRRAYAAAWRGWQDWAEARGRAVLPARPEDVAVHLAALAEAGYKVATLRLRVAALGARHREAGLAFDARHPVLTTVLAGICRRHGSRPSRKQPLLREDIAAMVAAIDGGSLVALRDRALLLLGFAGALRRSELVGLHCKDIEYSRHGLVLGLRSSKTDREGRGQEVALPRGRDPGFCPVTALQSWLAAAAIDSGPVFRRLYRSGRLGSEPLSDRAVADLVKTRAAAVGLDPARVGGHSLRAGLATSAALEGADLVSIMRQTRHKSVDVARGYVRVADRWRDNVAAKLF